MKQKEVDRQKIQDYLLKYIKPNIQVITVYVHVNISRKDESENITKDFFQMYII